MRRIVLHRRAVKYLRCMPRDRQIQIVQALEEIVAVQNLGGIPTSMRCQGNSPDRPYFHHMETTTVEERLTRIEREFDDLKHEVLGLKPQAKGWRQTVDAVPDDELSRNAEKLGREWREQANND